MLLFHAHVVNGSKNDNNIHLLIPYNMTAMYAYILHLVDIIPSIFVYIPMY